MYLFHGLIVWSGLTLFFIALLLRLLHRLLATETEISHWMRLFFLIGGGGGILGSLIVLQRGQSFGFFQEQPPDLLLMACMLAGFSFYVSAAAGKIRTLKSIYRSP